MQIGEGRPRSTFTTASGHSYPCIAAPGTRVDAGPLGVAITTPLSRRDQTCFFCRASYSVGDCEAAGYGVPGHTCPACELEGLAENGHSDESHPGDLADCMECRPLTEEAADLRNRLKST